MNILWKNYFSPMKRYLFFTSILFIQVFFFILSFVLKNKKSPRYLIFSVTEEQVVRNRNTHDFFAFLNEKRFGFNTTRDNSLIEVRKFKYFLMGKKISITYDSSLYIFLRVLNRRSLVKLFVKVARKTWAQDSCLKS